jgi:hypothetical protein
MGPFYSHRTISILESSSQNTDMSTFYGTLWTCMLSTASIRLSAVTFIMSRLNRKTALNQEYILGDDIPMTVGRTCLAARRSFIKHNDTDMYTVELILSSIFNK